MVNRVPPLRISGSARWAMRMKVQQDTSMVVRKPSCDTSTTRPCSASFGENAMECTTKSKFAPILGDAFEHRLQLAGCAHVERHQDRRFELAGERLDVFLG